jgi:apolipoprotein N-acyltransferase
MEGQATPLQEKVSDTVHSPGSLEAPHEPGRRFRPAGRGRPADTRAAARLPQASWLQLALPALASAGLLWSCYFPLGLGVLAWVALVPLLSLVRARASGRRLFFCAWLGGLAFFGPVLAWMRVADYRMYYTWAMLATYCALYFPLAIWLLRRLDQGTGLPLVLTVPVVWTALEFVRSWLLTGFAWYYLGHTQHTFLEMIQVADLGGVYLISFLIAAVNAWFFEVLAGFAWCRACLGMAETPIEPWTTILWRRLVQATVVGALVGGALCYGAYRLSEEPFTPGPRVALLQGNLDQRLRNAADRPGAHDAQGQIYSHFKNLSWYAHAQAPRPDLIVWPETSFPGNWVEILPSVPVHEIPPGWVDRALQAEQLFRYFAQQETQITTLLGLNSEVLVDGHKPRVRYNSALLVRTAKQPNGKYDGGIGGRYDKIHRVPFGEYVPLRDWLPFMNRFAPYDSDYSVTAGDSMPQLTLGQYRFGVLICFEDTDPFLARAYGCASADGPAVHFLVNISNDGWFDGSSEHDEHLAIARFRAVETRRSMVRAVNMGISAVIDGNGRVVTPILGKEIVDPSRKVENTYLWVAPGGPSVDLPVAEWNKFKKVRGVLMAVIPIDSRTSLYSLWGDWLPYTCWVVVGAGLAWVVVTRRRARRAGANV